MARGCGALSLWRLHARPSNTTDAARHEWRGELSPQHEGAAPWRHAPPPLPPRSCLASHASGSAVRGLWAAHAPLSGQEVRQCTPVCTPLLARASRWCARRSRARDGVTYTCATVAQTSQKVEQCRVHTTSSAAFKRARAILKACDRGVLKEGTGAAITCQFLGCKIHRYWRRVLSLPARAFAAHFPCLHAPYGIRSDSDLGFECEHTGDTNDLFH